MSVFYLLYLLGILVLVVLPGRQHGALFRTATLGSLLGLVAFDTLDLTCLALFVDFPLVVVVVDLTWGFLLTAAVSSAGFLIGRWLGISSERWHAS